MATTFDKVANFVYSTVLTAPSPAETGTTLVVQVVDGANFPDPSTNNYNLVVFPVNNQPTATNAEIVRVTAKTGNSLTIVREQEGTSARLILVGDQVILSPTAKNIDDITTALNTVEAWKDLITASTSEINSALDGITAGFAELNQLDGVTVGGTSAGDIVTIDDTQTLTNKTIQTTTLSTGVAVDASADPNITYYGMARQAIMNGNFDVWQRGTSVTPADTASTFLADRWHDAIDKNGGTLPTLTRSRQALTVGDIPNAFYYTRLNTNGAGTSLGVSSYHIYRQKIEYGTRFLCGAGKKVTVSFYARSDIANKRICPTLSQHYGSGGSPSAEEQIKGEPITLTANWTKYTVTFTTNTLVEKTFGTSADDSLALNLWLVWGTTSGNTYVKTGVTAETYVGSGNIDIAQVQLCAGSVALPFQPKSFEEELRACERYYQKSYLYGVAPGTGSSAGHVRIVGFNIDNKQKYVNISYRTRLRSNSTPSVWDYVGNASKISVLGDTGARTDNVAVSLDGASDTGCGVYMTSTASGFVFHWVVSAEF